MGKYSALSNTPSTSNIINIDICLSGYLTVY
jgi:hypothetical protein